MSKTDDLLRSAGASMAQASSLRPAPAAMPSLATSNRIGDARRDGLDRSKEYWMVPMDRIDRDVEQPREGGFDIEIDLETGEEKVNPDFKRLVDSLDRDGLLQPITLVHGETSGRYKVRIGERRFRAALSLGWEKIAARVIEPSEDIEPGEALAKQVIENLIRADLKPTEQARSFRTLLTVHDWTSARLAETLGYSAGYISQRLKLLDLPDAIQSKVDSGQIDAMRGYYLAQIVDEAMQEKAAARVVEEKLSVQDTKEVVKVANEEHAKTQSQTKPKASQTKVVKGRGASKAKAVPIKVREKGLRAPNGIKIHASRTKLFDLLELAEALETIASQVRAEIAAEPGAESEAA